jgi:phosphoribosylaminoimidazolecarboxamide formyltransferase/IMP cyclohydrolase
MTAPDLVPVRRALISVSDKAGVVEFAQALARRGVEILSTGGTARTLAEAGIAIREVSDWTGFPEMMDGRVKTLHPKVHGGLLALRDDPAHRAAMEAHDVGAIDLLAVNLYPFEETVRRTADYAACVENIDIGGPAMVRSAAKNHGYVAVLCDPADFGAVTAVLDDRDGATSLALRKQLAAKAFARTASYDAAISAWFAGELGEVFPERLALAGRRTMSLRYGENPHQQAAFYAAGEPRPGIATARQLQGKELSYNNLNDADAAFELAAEFPPEENAAVAIIKHANPCGIAVASSLAEAYGKALACDPVSAFGGVIAVNRPLDGATAAEIAKIFTEVIVAPEADEDARRILAGKTTLRLLVTGGLPDSRASTLTFKSLAGGFLAQIRDSARVERAGLKAVSKRAPSEAELADLLFAFTVAKHVKSNAIVYARGGATVGVGAGQMSRVDSARIAAWTAREAAEAAGETETRTRGAVVASDAFFPFADGLIAAAEAGVTAVIQPGGSVRDSEVIAAADERGLAMVFTGLRHFRH